MVLLLRAKYTIGLEKSLGNGELLNAVMVMMKQQEEGGTEKDLAIAIEAICALHNQNIADVVRTRKEFCSREREIPRQ